MQLFIIRHAPAAPKRAGRDDGSRPLTGRGKRRWRRSVAGLRALGLRFDRLYHSPWLRAVETADVAAQLLEGESVVTEQLAGPPRQALLDALRGRSVAVVGHEPWLSELVGWLTVGETSAGAHFVLKKGSVTWLEGVPKPGKMKVCALFTPRALRGLGRRR